MQIRQVAGPISLLAYDKSSWKLACRLAKSRPLGERSELFWPRSGDRERRSCERSTCLAWWVFICITRQKWEWRDSHLGFQVSFASPWLQWRNVLIRLRLNLLNLCVYHHHRRSKFAYFVRKLSLTMILGESLWPQRAGKKQKLVSISSQCFTTKESFTSAHILNLQRLFNTRISLPVTLTGSELTPQLNPSMKTFKSSKNAFVLEVTLTISEKKSPMRLNLPNVSQLYKRTMKCEKKFCLSLPRTTLLCILMSKWHLKSKIAERYPR